VTKARRLDGQVVATAMREEITPAVRAFAAEHGRRPGLGIVLVGDDPASHVYVKHKLKAAEEWGFHADCTSIAATASLDEVLAAVDRLNRSAIHDGILVQAPLPKAMGKGATQRVFDAIAVDKDVDGFAAENVGLLSQNRATLVACTPAGVIEMLVREGVTIAGQRAVVLGRSDIVGKPMALLLLHRDATVTICHSRTADLGATCRQADILVAAIGKPGFVTPEFIKPGATVVDVGINQVTDPELAASLYPAGHVRLTNFAARGTMLIGDVHPRVEDVAGALTPVPGGVGPLTITMLMKNTLVAAQARQHKAA
jgi:methylenetetrahydrofolate dehydrogenase (NADP+) / methenyltetrahydrofolate cyclohydrolase